MISNIGRTIVIVSAIIATGVACMAQMAAPDSNAITLPDSLPLQPHTLRVDPRFASTFPTPHTLNLPAGFSVNVFATNVGGARFMCWSPDSVLYVCAMGAGEIIALPDHNNDGIADSQIIVTSGLNTAHSLEFYRDTLYTAETGDVLKLIDTNGDRVIDMRSTFIGGFLTGGSHVTRTVVFDGLAHTVYVSVGSSCNLCDDPPDRACILQYNDDGTGKHVFASGLRNSVGLAIHPVSHALWANNNGFDLAGNDIPPEAVNIIEDGHFYGWPFAYGDKRFNPIFPSSVRPFTHADTLRVLGMRPPVAQLQAHSAPLGLHFYIGDELPAEYKNSAIMCYHGSWNRNPATGCKVVRLRSNTDGTSMRVADFISGFQTDSIRGTRWGRPVGVISDHCGNFYISDDQNGAIYRVHYSPPAGVHEKSSIPHSIRVGRVYPIPTYGTLSVDIESDRQQSLNFEIVDLSGAIISNVQDQQIQAGWNTISMNMSDLPSGNYYVRIAGEIDGHFLQIVH